MALRELLDEFHRRLHSSTAEDYLRAARSANCGISGFNEIPRWGPRPPFEPHDSLRPPLIPAQTTPPVAGADTLPSPTKTLL